MTQKGWIDDETFEFWVPAQALVVKSQTDKNGETKRWVQGIASTDSRDLQGEIVDQKGIDFSYFLKHGYFNNDHKPGFGNKVGEPTEAKVTKNGLWVKGYLYPNHQVANEIWDLMNAQEKAKAKRRVGFSIQGKVKRREGNVIKECWIQDIAITPCPVNTTTWAEIAKSLSAHQWDLGKSQSEEEEKALTTAAPLTPESLDGGVKDKREEDLDKSMTFNDTVVFVQESTGMSLAHAQATARVLFSLCKETTNE